MKLIYTTVTLLFFYISTLAQPDQTWSWSGIYKGTGSKGDVHTAVDINGNVYTLFDHYEQISYGNNTVPASSTDYNALLAKQDPDGNILYMKKFYADQFTSLLYVESLTVDQDENVYVAGAFQGKVTVGTKSVLDQSNDLEGYIAKFDRYGKEQWMVKLGNSFEVDRMMDITTDNDKNIIVCGLFYGSSRTYGGKQVQSIDYELITSVIKLNPSGAVIWANCHKRGKSGVQSRVATDGDNNIYLVGEAEGPISYDGTSYPVQYSNGIYISKFTANGDHVWSDMPKGGGQSLTGVVAIDIDDSSNIYVGGRTGYTNFITKYDSAGQSLWTKNMSQYRTSWVGLAHDNYNNCYFSGEVIGVWPGEVHGITQVKPDGTTGNSWKTGIHSYPGDIACDKANNLYISGSFRDSVQLGDSLHRTGKASYISDIYVAKLSAQELLILGNYDKKTYCAGDQVTVYFSQVDTAFDPGNSFVFELSDEDGGFGNPTSLGSKITPFQTDSFKFSIPGNTVEGNNYRVRIRSTSPIYYEVPDNIFAIGTYPQKPIISVSGQSLTATASGGNFQWYKDGQAIPGATGATFTPTSTGNYTVSVTTSYGCEIVSAAQFFIPVGVEELSIPDIKIHPNPVTDHLIVQNIPVGAVVNMVDVSGRVVHQNTAGASQLNIATEHLSSGVYFLVIKLEDGTQQQYKVVK